MEIFKLNKQQRTWLEFFISNNQRVQAWTTFAEREAIEKALRTDGYENGDKLILNKTIDYYWDKAKPNSDTLLTREDFMEQHREDKREDKK